MKKCRLCVPVALAAALVCSSVGCDFITGASNIEYRVSGTATRVSLTYETEDGTAQVSSASLPWSYSRRADDFLYVSAQIIQGTVGRPSKKSWPRR